MEGKLIDKVKLENGLVLQLYDRSRRVAEGRWLVSLEAHIDIGVKPEYFEGQGSESPSFEVIRETLGEKVTYDYEKTRNFIAETEKDEVLKGLKERFLNTTLTYFSSPNFPRSIILSRYGQASGNAEPWTRQ
ncbi:MAG: hypothetical protein JSV60_08875 [Desulfobacterales bacterium]|nr:MAG: hypothetical protein JSV60_08875 [Desulfobacterales bacterium]